MLRPYRLRPYPLRPYRRDHLDRLPIDGRERGAQRGVALDDRVEAALQHGDVEPAREAKGRVDVVGGGPRLQLVEEPQPLLGEGEWEGTELGALLLERASEQRPLLRRQRGQPL